MGDRACNGDEPGSKAVDQALKVDTTLSEVRTSAYTTRGSLRTPPIPNEDPQEAALSMILSQIDKESYERALVYDTERLLQYKLLPKSFVWNKPRVQLLRTLPRDIEDMPGVLNANTISPFHASSSTNDGSLGFGMFDMGGPTVDLKRTGTIEPSLLNYSKTGNEPEDQPQYPLRWNFKYEAAARRAEEPGIIELNVHSPPLPLDTSILSCQHHNIFGVKHRDPWLKLDRRSLHRANMFISAERSEMLGTMPFCWGGVEKYSQAHPLHSEDPCVNNFELGYEDCLDTVGSVTSDKDELYNATKRREKRKLGHTKVAQSSFRKWRLSVRVGGASSRYTLVKEKEGNKSTPMHLIASFPSSFQKGKLLSIEEAQKHDEKSNFYLGSYDCRASAPHASMSYQAMKTTKKEARAKKNIYVGRTRPIWSSFHQAGNNKIVCTSDLTGERLVGDSSKRPLETGVFIRLNGSIISISDDTKSKNYPKTTKFQQKVQWKDEDIHEAVGNVSKKVAIESTSLPPKPKKALCTFNAEEYLIEIAEAMKPPGPGKKRKSYASLQNDDTSLVKLKYEATDVLKYIKPRLFCLPLEDGYIRTVYQRCGSMEAVNVHNFLQSASTKQGRCSVCWSSDKKKTLLKCVSCGLMVHESCCKDKGMHTMGNSSSKEWHCPICVVALKTEEESPQQASSSSEDPKLPSRKSRRTSRLPTRFTENSELDNSVIRKNNSPSPSPVNKNNNTTEKTKKPLKQARRPSWRCTLCPHGGGAMSQLGDLDDDKRWTHEICRIWCPRKKQKPETRNSSADNAIKNSTIFETKFGTHCCICGEKDISCHKDRSGLIKCAAVGCNLMFHPMCATLVTQLDTSSRSFNKFTLNLTEVSYEVIKENRQERRDTLFIARDGTKTDQDAHSSKKIVKRIVPIGFCCLHNPMRDKSLYGCTDNGYVMSDFMNVPYQQ